MSIKKVSCFNCKRDAFYFRKYSGEYLCKECFKKSIITKTRRTISKYKMIRYGDRVGVAVSGGKDSLSLLQVLSKLAKEHSNELYAITVDEGIANYREESISFVKEFTDNLRVPLKIVSYEDLYGFSLDEAMKERKIKLTSCTFCGVLRRRALDLAAKELKVNVLCTAHNLDDIIQSFMINLLVGEMDRIKWVDPRLEPKSEFAIRRVKPFMELYEEEISLYAYLNNIPFQSIPCPYSGEGIRGEIRRFLNSLEAKHAGAKYGILKTALKMAQNLNVEGRKQIKFCVLCGNLSSSSICQVCKMLGLVNLSPILP
ncbi:MAG: TIGR00269 family protein [Nitrososphaerales archaeon]